LGQAPAATAGGAPNFDVRAEQPAKGRAAGSAAARAAARERRVRRAAAFDTLRSSLPNLDVTLHAYLDTPEVVGPRHGQGVLAAAQGDRAATLRSFLGAHAEAYGLQSGATDLRVVSDYVNPAGNIGWVELEQQVNGIPVFQGAVRGAFTAKGDLARTVGVLASVSDESALVSEPSLTAAEAVGIAAGSVGWSVDARALVEIPGAAGDARVRFARGVLADDPVAWPVYFPVAADDLRLAWATTIVGDVDGYLTVVDALDGTLLFRKNLASYQSQPVTLNIYPSDSPAPLSPTPVVPGSGTQAPFVPRQTLTLVGNEAPNAFNTLGWLTDGVTNLNGNNVHAGLDLAAPDGIDFNVTSPARDFTAAYDPASDAPGATGYRIGDVANMFYWSNVFHDRLYRLGFTEAAGNFQHDNFGRGGAANDRVLAQGQDNAGVNNANFLTQPDGAPGRLQMFVFTGPTPDRSSGLDAEVLLHELAHGLSSRLHANAAGLTFPISAGMSEGWSDFYARALLSTPDEDPHGIYAPAAWLSHQVQSGFADNYYYGIRRLPYAARHRVGPNGRPHNPLTFADLTAAPDVIDGAYPPSPVGLPDGLLPHRIGEVWASALFEVRARFIERLGFAEGNQRILQYVTDAMKLEAANPTFLAGRDALLAAVYMSGGSTPDADAADIWAGFAARGMGSLASEAADGTAQTESFSVPGQEPTITVDDLYLTEGDAGTRAFAFTVRRHNSDGAPARVRFRTSWTGSADQGRRFINGNPITVNDNFPASPYPKNLVISGITGTVDAVGIDVSLNHSWVGDIDMLLVGPLGQRLMLMSDVVERSTPNPLPATIMDGAPPFPSSSVWVPIEQSFFAPTDYSPGETLPSPAPGAPNITTMAGFNGVNPNGTWQLFVVDDTTVDTGTIGQTNLLITTRDTADYIPRAGEIVFPPGVDVQQAVVNVYGDTVVEPNQQMQIVLFDPANAVIADNAAIATIINDDGGGALPTTTTDAFTAAFNTALTVGAPGVLANDTANGAGTLTAFLINAPGHGALQFSANGGFTYTPAAGYFGPDSFTYRALNQYGQSAVTTAALTVNPPPPPSSAADAYATGYLAPLSVGAPGVLANDALNGAAAMTATLVSPPPRGTVTLAADGSFTYTPPQYFAGADTFTYRATSAGGAGSIASVTITVAQPTEVQEPIDLQAWSVNGNEVTLRWTAPPVGPLPTGFVIEGGLVPGQVLASLPTGSPAPVYTFVAPTGSFYVRVHALAGATRSAASNEIPLHVNVPVMPAAPTGLLGLVNGSNVTLAWRNLYAGGPPSTVVLDVSGAAVLSMPLGRTEAFSFVGVPPGTYTLSVRAMNAGGISTSSNAVTLTFPGVCSGPPAPPTSALAYLVGTTGHVIWGPPASGPAPSFYTLAVSGAFNGAFSTPGRRLSGAIGPGIYNLALTASNACGSSAPVNLVLNVP
jgi:subtilisin-like proprotein convertase family protein